MPLKGIRVVDIGVLLAGPLAATFLGDFGAEVIKVEHPHGDSLRSHGHAKDGVPLWWKVVARNKYAVTLDLSKLAGQQLLLRLVEKADVLVESFRPGTLERWNLSPVRLQLQNPGLIVLRTTGFGQFGPYSHKAGYGTIAESMSGFAHVTGPADGPPTLPPFGLADGIAGLAGALATMFALFSRDARGGPGQVIDLALIEPILTILGAQPTIFDQLGVIQGRTGNRTDNNAPRNTYRTRDERWVAISTSSQSVAERVMRMVGRRDFTTEPWFATGRERAEHADQLDEALAAWVGERSLDDVLKEFDDAEAAAAPIYNVSDVMSDPQYRALESVIRVPDEDLGTVAMQNVLFRMSRTPGRIRWTGRKLGQDNESVYTSLGLSSPEIAELRLAGVI